MPYTAEQYQKTSILHPLIADAVDYAIEHLAAGWSNPRKALVIAELMSLYGLEEREAREIVGTVVIGLIRASQFNPGG